MQTSLGSSHASAGVAAECLVRSVLRVRRPAYSGWRLTNEAAGTPILDRREGDGRPTASRTLCIRTIYESPGHCSAWERPVCPDGETVRRAEVHDVCDAAGDGQGTYGTGQGDGCRVRRVKGRSAGEEFRSAVSPQCPFAGLCALCGTVRVVCHPSLPRCPCMSPRVSPLAMCCCPSLTGFILILVRQRHGAEGVGFREASDGRGGADRL